MLADSNRPFTPTKEFGNKVFGGPARYFEIEVGANLRRATGRERRARVQLVTNERGIRNVSKSRDRVLDVVNIKETVYGSRT